MCPPSNECLIARLSSLPCPSVLINVTGMQSFGAQGRHEPVVCPKKYYCSTPMTIAKCPAGHFCPTGTITPRKCDLFSYCPEGKVAQRSFNGIVAFVLVDIVLYLLYFFRSKKDKELLLQDASYLKLNNTPDSEKAEKVKRDLEANFKKSMNGKTLRLEFTMERLGYKLPTGKEILQNVSGKIRAGKLTAIMGPSGAGKTTFLNVLSGKLESSFGKLLISGKQVSLGNFKQICGFVPQEDIMCREMTVSEIILHSARMRLPSSWSPLEIKTHAELIIQILNLSHVKNTPIGDGVQRGISGGQRKRVNIGIELAATPLCLCLDEPTSGLDSTAALEVVDVLRRIAEIGMTVTAVIHQPRVEIFKKYVFVFVCVCKITLTFSVRFHNCMLICPGGKTAFLGGTEKAKPYFESLGYEVFYGSPSFSHSCTFTNV